MNDAQRLKRLNLLSGLAVRLASESAGGLLSDTLSVLLTGLGSPAGVAFEVDEERPRFASERGFRATPGARDVLGHIAARVLASRRAAALHDVRSPLAKLENSGELTSLGFQALIAVPVLHRRERLAVLVALFPQGAALDEEGVDFARGIANVLGLAVARDSATSRAKQPGTGGSGALVSAQIAHELRGPVGALSLQLEEQARLVSELSTLAGSADTVLGAGLAELEDLTRDIHAVMNRLRQVVGQLGASRAQRENPLELLDLSELVRDVLAERRPHLERAGVVCDTSLSEACEVVGRRHDLREAAQVLLEHAADRCVGVGGKVHVSVSNTPHGVAFSVGDNGARLTLEEQRKLASGQHGNWQQKLRVVHDVVRELAGHLEVRTSRGYPVILSLLLPSASSDSGVFQVPDSSPVRVVRRAEVLVVDDDDVFTRTMRRALKPHTVRTASSASEAEIALLDPSFLPDLVLCDIFLPGSNGDELHARVAERRPEVAARFVFATGGALTASQASYLRSSGCPTLHKPLDINQLRDLLIERCPMDSASVRTLSPNEVTSSRRDSQA